MTTITCTFDEAIQHANEAMQSQSEVTLLTIADKLAFAIGEPQNTFNPQKIQELGGQIYNGKWNGGTCVVFPYDLSICIISRLDIHNTIGNKLISNIKTYLEQQNLTILRDGNDLLIYIPEQDTCKKIASYAVSTHNNMLETVVHVSIGMDEDIIKQVCTKPVKKQPAGLKQYNISAQEIINYIKPLLN